MVASFIKIHYFFLFAFMAVFATLTNANNITEILSHFPEYGQFNSYLTMTKLADEINTRTPPVTVLVVTDGALSSLTAKYPALPVIKNALELHVLLDYWDPARLHDLSDGTTLTTTFYQTTGNAAGNSGFVNITDLRGGRIGFGSAVPGSTLDSRYTKSVKQIPYNISVVEIDKPIMVLAVLNSPPPSVAGFNITAALEKAGCRTFASLLVSTGVMQTYQTAAYKGLTIFAPNDGAFDDEKLNGLKKKLTKAEVVALLQYHAVADYTPMGTLKTTKVPISTLASNGVGKYAFSTITFGDELSLDTGVNSSRVASVVLDSLPLCIFTVDNVLLPTELFGNAPSLAPVSAPEVSPAPVTAPKISSTPVTAPKISPAPVTAPKISPAPVTAPKISPAPVTAPKISPALVTAPKVSPAPVTAPKVSSAPVTTPKVSPAPVTAPKVSPAPVPAPKMSPTPKVVTSPTPAPKTATAPTLMFSPPTSSPVGAPVEAVNNSADVNAPALLKTLFRVSILIFAALYVS